MCRATVEAHSVAGSSLFGGGRGRRPGTHCQTSPRRAVSVTSGECSPFVNPATVIEMLQDIAQYKFNTDIGIDKRDVECGDNRLQVMYS